MFSFKDLKCDKKLLEENYKEALKKEDFKLLVEKLKVNDDILMKYTSYLEESAVEFSNCLNCKGLCDCKNKLIGHAYLPRVLGNNIEFNYKKCNYMKKQDKNNLYQKNIIYYNVTDENKNASFERIDKRIKGREEAIIAINKAITELMNGEKGIYLSGSTGTGKTYMMMSLINEFAKNNIKCAVAFWPDFLRNLKNSFDTDYMEKVDYLINVPVLLIDDLGGEALTPWARDEVLFPILQGRLSTNKLTFITSNLDKDLLYDHLSLTRQGTEVVKAERIMSRINSLTKEITVICKDMRI